MSVRILEGDALQVLRTLSDCSVQMCVTSPPYFGLRDYGTGLWEGGDASCDHKAGSNYGTKNDTSEGAIRGGPFRDACGKCGASRVDRQLGLEKTPDLYVEAMVGVFREVKRVLRDDGTLWLNIGDSYAANASAGTKVFGNAAFNVNRPSRAATKTAAKRIPAGLKSKDLIGVPWLLAFALRADGWYLRSDIIWHKPNPMPESVTDRPTKSHEYLFLLSKSPTYYYDADAIRAPLSAATVQRDKTPRGRKQNGGGSDISMQGADYTIELGNMQSSTTGRNARSVWTVNTSPYSEAHFATFPPKLIEPCILAGSAKQACEKCGAPWERETIIEREATRPGNPIKADDSRNDGGRAARVIITRTETLGFSSTCDCENSGTGKSLVLDPFGGAGTTGLVADRLGRDALLIELNPKYAEMARRRIHSDNPLFGDVA